jgi:hypothetical protein
MKFAAGFHLKKKCLSHSSKTQNLTIQILKVNPSLKILKVNPTIKAWDRLANQVYNNSLNLGTTTNVSNDVPAENRKKSGKKLPESESEDEERK